MLNVFRMKPGQTLAVFGAGSLGLSAVMAARIAGAAEVVAVDLHPNRLQLATELGADHAIRADGGSVHERIRDLIPHGVDFALDTTAIGPVMLDAIASLAPHGSFGFVAPTETGELTVPLRPLMMNRRVLGIMEGNSNPDVFIPQLVDFHMQGVFPFDRLVRFYPFDDIEQAFHDSEAGTTVKPILEM